MNKYQKRAARGAAALDQAKPGWDNDINLDLLDLTSNHNCVIAQAYHREWFRNGRGHSNPFCFGVFQMRKAGVVPFGEALGRGAVWAYRRGFIPITDRHQTQTEVAWRELILNRREERWAKLDAERALLARDRNLALSA